MIHMRNEVFSLQMKLVLCVASTEARRSRGRESRVVYRDNVSPGSGHRTMLDVVPWFVSSSYEHLLPSNVRCGAEPAGCVRRTGVINRITPASAFVVLDLGGQHCV